MPKISPKAAVDPAAKLADDVTIGAFAWIGPDVKIAEGCRIDNNVTITGRTTLGEGNHVFPLASIGLSADGSAENGECVISEANSIREHVTIYAGGETSTRIGKDNLIMNGCTVGTGATLGDHGIFANLAQIGPDTRVEDYVRMSAFTSVAPGVVIGAYTFAAGYVAIDHDAPPFAILHGCPYRVRGVNSHNLKRCGFGEDDIRELKQVFRKLFNGEGRQVNEAALRELMERPKPGRYVQLLLDALNAGSSSLRGMRR